MPSSQAPAGRSARRSVRVPLRRRATPRDWEASRPRPAAPFPLPRAPRPGSRGLPRVSVAPHTEPPRSEKRSHSGSPILSHPRAAIGISATYVVAGTRTDVAENASTLTLSLEGEPHSTRTTSSAGIPCTPCAAPTRTLLRRTQILTITFGRAPRRRPAVWTSADRG